jgi:hypothetical protein
LEAATTPFDRTKFEIAILLEFELNDAEMLDVIVDQFYALTGVLDSMSQT